MARQSTRGAPRKYCSDTCRLEAWNDQRRQWTIDRRVHHEQRACGTCGRDYVPTRKDQRYCSAECHRKRKQPYDPQSYDPIRERAKYQRRKLKRIAAMLASWAPPTTPPLLLPGPAGKSCGWCSQRFEPRKNRTYCSPECAGQANKANQRQWSSINRPSVKQPFIGGPCHECGLQFLSPRAYGARYCSEDCRLRNQRRRGKTTRSKRIKEGTRRETIDLARLAQRDGWRCHICKRKVTRKTWSHDHLIPLSDGGAHTWDNIALAHHRCNSQRGTRGAAQLLLVG